MARTGRPKGVVSRARMVTCVCGTSFETRHSQGKYCSDECRRNGERQSWAAYGARNRESRRAFHRRHYREHSEQVNARVDRYRGTDAGKVATRRAGLNQKAKSPEKIAARQAVSDAIKSGRLVRQPCETCGALKVHAHHDDYTKPLEVRWLCNTHHKEHHRLLRETNRPVGIEIVDGTIAAIDGEPVPHDEAAAVA